eukprot:229184_1
MTQELCRFYGSVNGCRYGDNCRYSHVNSTPVCKFYLNNSCLYGNGCKYKHNTDNVKSTINDISSDNMCDSNKIMTTNDVGEIKFKRIFYGQDGRMYCWYFGNHILDRKDLQVQPNYFTYNHKQHTLICSECDFSFTLAIILKRGGLGINLCSTTFNAGLDKRYWKNYKFCYKKRCKISFGVDAKSLESSEKRWSDKYGNKFDS